MKKITLPKIMCSLFRGFSGYTTGVFLLSMLIGSICVYFFSENSNIDSLTLFSSVAKQLPQLDISSADVAIFSLKQNLPFFLLLVFFAFTNVFRMYHFIFTACCGFSYGILLEFCMLSFGLEGILTFLCCCIPHCIILIIVYLTGVTHLIALHHEFFRPDSATTRHSRFLSPQKRQLCFKQLPFLIRSILLLLLASLMEGYLNLPLLQTYLSNM